MKIDKRRVVVYGAGDVGIAAKRTLDHDSKVNMIVVAFIDDDERKTGKAIEGVKIFHSDNFRDIVIS